MSRSKLETTDIQTYVFAGNAIFTVLNPLTGNRFTYKVRCLENEDGSFSPPFVSILSGQDNNDNYTYIGFIRGSEFIHAGQKTKVSRDAPSVQAFIWFLHNIKDPQPAEVWHEGRCGRCGRKLTVPDSIQSGLGPVCQKSYS